MKAKKQDVFKTHDMLRKITALRLQKKNRRRVNVYLDDRYAFGLQAPVAASLKVGQMLSQEEVEQLQEQDAIEIAHSRALHYLSYRPRSRAEMEAYLKRRQVAAGTIEAVVDRLTGSGLLDDEAFARYWVENREQFRPRALQSLRFELRRKGVADTTIERATEGIDEAESAYRAARHRAERLKQMDFYVFRHRLGGFLQRRGFGYTVVKETVARLWRETQDSTQAEPF